MKVASDNQVTIVGNLTDDPELRYTPNGAAVAKFRVAVSPRFKDENGQWKDGDTSYFSISAWRALAENAAESLTRGTRVVVTGRSRPISATQSWPGANEAGCPPIVYDVTSDALARDQAPTYS